MVILPFQFIAVLDLLIMSVLSASLDSLCILTLNVLIPVLMATIRHLMIPSKNRFVRNAIYTVQPVLEEIVMNVKHAKMTIISKILKNVLFHVL